MALGEWFQILFVTLPGVQEHGARRKQEQVFLDVLFAQKQDATSWTGLFLNFTLRLLRFKQNNKQGLFPSLFQLLGKEVTLLEKQ